MKIQYILLTSLCFGPNFPLKATTDDLKDERPSNLENPLRSESSLARNYEKYLNEYKTKYDEIIHEQYSVKHSKNKHVMFMRLCDNETNRTSRIEELAHGLSLMTAIKKDPTDDMNLEELKRYRDYGSTKQRLMMTEILIQREEIDEALNWEYLAYPINELSAYDLYFGRMLIMLTDYALIHRDQQLCTSLLDILQYDLKSRLQNWAFGSQEYLREIGYEYLDRLRRIMNENIFDEHFFKTIDVDFLKDKKWHKIGRYSIELLKTQVDTLSVMLEHPNITPHNSLSFEDQDTR